MILFDLCGGDENHAAYQDLSIDNLERQYDFLRSIVRAAIATERPMISTRIIGALNAHAITCLHVNAGLYRPGPVTVGNYEPPAHFHVPELMNDFVNYVNRMWGTVDTVVLAAYALWRLNNIHPFVNGNGRTARALCYYIICINAGGMLAGETIIPELIKRDRVEYVELLRATDASAQAGTLQLSGLHEFLVRLIEEQLASAADD